MGRGRSLGSVLAGLGHVAEGIRTAKSAHELSILIYFATEDVASLAKDLAAQEHFANWIVDLASPGQLRLMQRTTGKQLSEAGAAFKFGPAEGAKFFEPYGWESIEVQGMLKTAAQFKRAPAELLSLLPEPKGNPGNYPWTGVCLLKKR